MRTSPRSDYRASGRSARRWQGARLGSIPKQLATRTTSPKVIDARGTLNTDQSREADWTIRTLGRA
ncbi:hypothetical protein ACWGHM_36840 [Streptomyces sp. NPDC054904]